MTKDNLFKITGREEVKIDARSVLDEIIREGAQKMLQTAIKTEVKEYIEKNATQVDIKGHRLVKRNGYLPERKLVTGAGKVLVKQPRVRDERTGQKFTSSILPPFMRRVPSIDTLIPALYLKGISTGDFKDVLKSILGDNAVGLSATNIVRLKEGWKKDYETWAKRDMSDKRYIYLWADGIYFNVRLDKERPCMLVIMGANRDGRKELVAVWDGYRESKISWLTVLDDLKKRGLEHSPKLAVGDGALGFWAALEESFPETLQQHCWVHKTANILDKTPKSIQVDAKSLIHEMYLSPTLQAAREAQKTFVKRYQVKNLL